MLPPFHGERMEAHRATVAALAEAEVARWAPGRPLRTLPRMQELTLDVILRVVLGAPDPRLRAAIRARARHDHVAAAPDRALARAARLGAVAPVPARGRARRRAAARGDPRTRAPRRGAPAVLDELIAAGATEDELRDQVVTLLAAGHETTAGSLAWALERLARHPHVAARLRDGDDAYLDATVKEVLRMRPVLSITPRKVRRAVRGRRLDAAAGRARDAVPLPRAPPSRAVARPDRVPPRALPRRRARALRVAAVRRRRAPLRRRRVRDDGAARGAARGRAPLRPARPTGRRASGCAAAASR